MAEPEKEKKKLKGFKEHDPSKYIDTEPKLDEAVGRTVVFAWGRMNPITAGHEKLVRKVAAVAKAEKAVPMVFLTHSFDKKKNPLAYDDKVRYASKAFGPIVKKSNAKTIFQVMGQLERQFKRVILVAGSDRVKEFDGTLNKYNGKDYKFDEIKVVSAGERDPDADNVAGISGTKMREFAAKQDVKQFTKNLPKNIKADAAEIMLAVRKGMGMTEENLEEALTRQQRRKRAIAMKKARHKIRRGREKAKKRTATLEVLKKRAKKAALGMLKQKFAKNRRYAELSPGEKEVIDKRIEKISKKRIEAIARKLLPKVKQKERDRKKSMAMGGSSTPGQKREDVNERFEMFVEDYYKGVPKDKKDDREAHFKKHAEKPGDGADKDSNYKDAPGDIGKDGERVKTKVSKHTKKYKDMFGESMWGKYVSKRPHMLLDKDNKVKFDGRFKMYKPKLKEEHEDLTEELFDLIESTEEFSLELNEDPSKSLKKKADKTGMPMGILRQVYNRGVAAWKSGHRPGTTPEQWGHARVNSFVTKSSGTWGKADSDLAAKVRKSKKEEVELEEDVSKMSSARLKFHATKKIPHGSFTNKEIKDEHKRRERSEPNYHTVKPALESVELDEVQNKSNAMAAKPKNTKAERERRLAQNMKKLKDMRKSDKSWAKSSAFDYHEEVELDEVLDTPKAMDSYKNKAKASKDRATSSAAAKILRGKDKDGNRADHSPELKTMAKRDKGLAAADRNAKKKTFKALRGEAFGDNLTKGQHQARKNRMNDMAAKASAMRKKEKGPETRPFPGLDKSMAANKAKNEEGGAGDEGTNELVNKFKKDTPNA